MSKIIPRTGIWKSLASANNEMLVPVTLNETDMERLIVKLLERLVRQGRASKATRDPNNEGLKKLYQDLAGNPKLAGFNTPKGKQVLEGWLRASVLAIVSAGRNRKGVDKIDYFVPHTAAVYRSGFPKQNATSRYRKADIFAYHAIVDYLAHDIDAQEEFQAIFTGQDQEGRTILSRGIDFGLHPRSAPKFIEGSSLDIETLLELRAIEQFPGPEAADKPPLPRSPFPSTSTKLGSDLVEFLKITKNLSSHEVTLGLQGILGFHLYSLPLITALELDRKFDIVKSLELESEIDEQSITVAPLELYFDFTTDSNSQSNRISNLCVSRDFSRFRRLFDNMILLREVEVAIAQSSMAGEYKRLDSLEDKVGFQVRSINVDEIRMINQIRLNMLMDAMSSEERAVCEQVTERFENPSVKLAKAIIADREKDGLAGMRKWAYSTGGLEPKSRQNAIYLLSGTKRSPTTWSYRLSDELLTLLIQLVFIHERQPRDDSPTSLPGAFSPSLPLAYLLTKLEERYGVLISKTPRDMRSDEDQKAANENLKAFKSKLKLLGLFEGLSDDSYAQYVRNPMRSANGS